MEQEASRENEAFRVRPDQRDSELMVNRVQQVLLVQKETRAKKEIKERKDSTELLEPQDCLENPVGMD